MAKQRLGSWLVIALTVPFLGFSSARTGSSAGAPVPAKDRAVLERTAEAFNAVAKSASPAVVTVTSVRPADPLEGVAPELRQFLPPNAKLPGQGEPTMGLGSGVIIRPEGIVVTNNHVVEHADRVTVNIDENTKFDAEVIGSDPHTDVALVRIINPKRSFPVVQFADSGSVEVGDWAVAIGNPFGLSHTVTSGIISAKGRARLGAFETEDFIQTDAAINPGNSGGPLLNLEGRMVGLNAAIYSQSGGSVGIGFSIPSNLVKEISDQILANGRVIRGWMGIVAQDLSPELATYFHSPSKEGALISKVSSGGPADHAGVREGDVILSYNTRSIRDSGDFKNQVAHSRINARIPLEVLRQGQHRDLAVLIQEQPQPPHAVSLQRAGQAGGAMEPLGLSVSDAPQGLGHGVLVMQVTPGSRAFDAGIEPGDVVLKLNDQPVDSSTLFAQKTRSLRSENKPLVLYVQRGPEDRLYIALPPAA